jgi:hypothetical protein
MKILQVVENAYRATLEEQDDTIIWLTHAMKGAGAELDVLLRGNAVNYVLQGQDASGLAYGDWQQTQPPTIDGDLGGLLAKGVNVFYVEDDADLRGINGAAKVEGVTPIANGGLAKLFAEYDQVWHW